MSTIYRVGERIYPTIPELSKQYEVDIFKTAQMSDSIDWYGDLDFRKVFDEKYQSCVNEIFYKKPKLNKYDLILIDDSRPRNGVKEIYSEAKKLDIQTVSNYHGSSDFNKDTLKRNFRYWDKTFLFGKKDYERYVNSGIGSEENYLKGGIPANDALNNYERMNEYILVIVNFLGNRTSPFDIQVDYEFIIKTGLIELQREFNKKVIFKLKSRLDHPYPIKDVEYLNDIVPDDLDFDVVVDCENDNKLICDSFIVISAPSTLALKSIQKGIPTILIKNSGQIGCFYDYDGLVDLNTQKIFDEIELQHNTGRNIEFISNTIEGGIDFDSKGKYVNEIGRLL